MCSKILFLLASGGLVVMIIALPAEAARTRYSFCMQGASSPGLSKCTFANLAQCQATASGRLLTCIANPFYKGRHH